MRPIFLCGLLVACVGSPPVPCTDCGGSTCIDTQTDSKNCGGCGKACAAGQRCEVGACKSSCATGQTTCNAQCVDTQNDSRNCGGCGQACGAGQLCVSGQCSTNCALPNKVCGGACVNTQNDPQNCGTCGAACDGGFCAAGACKFTCEPPLAVCSGTCTDLRGDPNNCGTCGTVCTPAHVVAASCNAGACAFTACSAGFNDCDGDLTNGCEVQGPCVRSLLVSHTPDGGYPNGSSATPVISADGTRVLFLSAATNLVPGDPSANVNVFQWDLRTNAVTHVDTLSDGGWPTQAAAFISLSPNGRYACINHNGPLADNAIASSSGNAFWKDLQTGVTKLASAFADGGPLPPGTPVDDCQVSDDGRYVGFSTRAVFDPVDTGGEADVYIHDMTTGVNRIVSVGTNGQVGSQQGYGFNAFVPRFSGDFTKAAWTSAGGFPTDNNSCFDTWFRDLDAGVTTKVSVSGACATSAAGSGPVQIFGPKSTVVTNSSFPDLPGDNDGVQDIYFRDLTPLGNPTLHSDSQVFALPNSNVFAFNVTSDGRYLLEGTAATNLAPARGSAGWIFVKDLATFSVEQVNLPEANGANGTRSGRLSDNGRAVTWDTGDTVAPGDTNGQFDVFWRQLR